MRRSFPLRLAAGLGALALSPAVHAAPTLPQGDPEVIDRILDEALNRSKVFETLTYLSEQIGTRLTGSSGVYRANVWARETFQSYGLENAHLFKWGDIPVGFDRGPSTVRMVEPAVRDFEFTTRAWDAGTDGPVSGKVIKEPETMDELDAVMDELEGAWILSRNRRRRSRNDDDAAKAAREEREKIAETINAANIAGRLNASRNDQVTTGGLRGWRDLTMDTLPTDVSITIRRSDYDSINSRLSDGEEVTIEADLVHYFNEGPIPVFNTIAEIRGTEFPDEVVILSAHLDSWNGPGSMGTQDNGTGSSVMLEAARLLMAAEVKPRRTIRFCLWTGEEQGLLGSRGYVDSLSEEELSKISACFVDDGGTNYQGGLVCVAEMLPMLEEAVDPLRDAFPELPVDHSVQEKMPSSGSSDHASFNRAGVPGFFWLEKGSGGSEGKNYRFVWHTQNDTPRYAVEEYLVQSSACSAVTAYNLAMADTLLPRYVPPTEEEEEAAKKEEAIAKAEEKGAPVIDASFQVVEAPFNGVWSGEFAETGGTFTMTLALGPDNVVAGSYSSARGAGPLEKGTWDAETKQLSFVYEAASYGELPITATIGADGSIAGKMMGTMAFTAKRAGDLPKPGEAQVGKEEAKADKDGTKADEAKAEAGGAKGGGER